MDGQPEIEKMRDELTRDLTAALTREFDQKLEDLRREMDAKINRLQASIIERTTNKSF
jgi:hypothetical protein